MSTKNEPEVSKADRYHSEARESVDAVLERMCKAIGVDPRLRGYAEALDISKETIKTWRRRGEVSLRFLARFASANGVNLDYLRKGHGEPFDGVVVNPVGVSEGGAADTALAEACTGRAHGAGGADLGAQCAARDPAHDAGREGLCRGGGVHGIAAGWCARDGIRSRRATAGCEVNQITSPERLSP